jgi:hypothetical protein
MRFGPRYLEYTRCLTPTSRLRTGLPIEKKFEPKRTSDAAEANATWMIASLFRGL